MRKLVFLTCLMVLLFSNTAYSGTAPEQGCATLGCFGKVDRLYLHDTGVIKIPPPIGSAGPGPDVVQCTLSENTYFVLKREHPNFKEIYSSLLSAHIAQKDVYLRVVQGSPDCEVHYAVIY